MTLALRSLLTALAIFLALAPIGPASAAIPPMRFSIRPDPHGSVSEGADYFVIDSEQGAVVRDALQLSNPGERPVRVRLRPVDAMSAQLGGVDYSAATKAPERAGAWIDLDRTSLTIPGGAARLVHFEVSVPQDARPGVNLAGIAAWTPPPKGAEERGDEGLDAAVHVQSRRVVAVQVNLPGPDAPVLVIPEVTAIGRPDGIYVQVTIRNDGHGFAAGEGVLQLGEGDDAISRSFALDKVVPDTVVWYPIRWRDEAPRGESYPASVEIDYGSGLAEWQGEVTVGGTVREALVDRGIESESGAPVVLVAAAAGTVALSVVAGWVLKRRRRPTTPYRGTPPSAQPIPPPAPAPVVNRVSPPPPAPRRSRPPPPPPPLRPQPLVGPTQTMRWRSS